MTRDLELVIKILKHFRDELDIDALIPVTEIVEGRAVAIEGYEGKVISGHIDIMYEAGLLEGYANRTPDGRLAMVWPSRLTWQGHEFLAAASNLDLWDEAKEVSKKKGLTLPFDIFQKLLFKLLESAAGLS